MLLSCSAKKVTKEGGIGEALRLGAPARRAALPYVPHPARTWYPLEHLNGKNLISACGLTVSGGSALAALPMLHNVTLQAKNRNIFCLNRIVVKVLQSYRKCVPGVSKEAASFGTFLGEARKVYTTAL